MPRIYCLLLFCILKNIVNIHCIFCIDLLAYLSVLIFHLLYVFILYYIIFYILIPFLLLPLPLLHLPLPPPHLLPCRVHEFYFTKVRQDQGPLPRVYAEQRFSFLGSKEPDHSLGIVAGPIASGPTNCLSLPLSPAFRGAR